MKTEKEYKEALGRLKELNKNKNKLSKEEIEESIKLITEVEKYELKLNHVNKKGNIVK
jgi:hypothetical protein